MVTIGSKAVAVARARGYPLLAACTALSCVLAAPCGIAQVYPAKPVRYLVAFSAGSGADTLGRLVAAGLTETLGQQVIVENRTGAAGNIAADIAAKAPPDGYLVFQGSQTHAVNATLYRNLPYDVLRDFVAVTQLASSPNVVAVHPSLPVKTIGDLVKLARAKPGEINYASAGVGSATFLAAEMFKAAAGINMMHVPYRGGGEAIIAVMTGEASLQFGPIASWEPHLKAGRGRALAITSSRRLVTMPDLPTVAESGYPDYASGNWYGLLLPVKAPRSVVSTLHAATVSAMNAPALNKRLVDLGYLVIGDQPDAFAAHIRSEVEKLGKIIKTLGLTTN
jgi:tripartite-type tricarboxylate transporter receptor subunit TctC